MTSLFLLNDLFRTWTHLLITYSRGWSRSHFSGHWTTVHTPGRRTGTLKVAGSCPDYSRSLSFCTSDYLSRNLFQGPRVSLVSIPLTGGDSSLHWTLGTPRCPHRSRRTSSRHTWVLQPGDGLDPGLPQYFCRGLRHSISPSEPVVTRLRGGGTPLPQSVYPSPS